MKQYRFGNPDAPVQLIQMVGEHDAAPLKNEAAHIRELAGADFCLLAFQAEDWNRDLSPWPAPAVFGTEGFAGGARETLNRLLERIPWDGRTRMIGGYSLAGLFALWAAYQTDLFSGVAAASPSVWFPGFTEYMEAHALQTGKVYLSLGDREMKTRNPVMATVGDCIRTAFDQLRARDVLCTLEWNGGNHFRDPDLRTAKAFAWLLRQQTSDLRSV